MQKRHSKMNVCHVLSVSASLLTIVGTTLDVSSAGFIMTHMPDMAFPPFLPR